MYKQNQIQRLSEIIKKEQKRNILCFIHMYSPEVVVELHHLGYVYH